MTSSMQHKGVVNAGRLSPVIWGNFPVKNALVGLGGEMFMVDPFNINDISEDDRVGEGTASWDATNFAIDLTAGGSANDAAVLSSRVKLSLSGRFAVEGSINIDTIADGDNAVFVGFSGARDGDFLADGADGAAAISAGTVGVYIDRDAGGDETDSDSVSYDAGSLLIATRGDSGSARIKDSGSNVAAGTATKIGLVHRGDGIVRLFVNDSEVATDTMPTIASGYAVIGTKAEGSGAPVLDIGRFFAAGVSD